MIKKALGSEDDSSGLAWTISCSCCVRRQRALAVSTRRNSGFNDGEMRPASVNWFLDISLGEHDAETDVIESVYKQESFLDEDSAVWCEVRAL